MNANFWQKGETLDYVAAEAVKNGQVINLSSRIGIAGSDIPAGETGHVHVVGVFVMDKAAEQIPMGTPVYYAADADVITKTETGNVPAGYAAADAAEADATVLVKLLG